MKSSCPEDANLAKIHLWSQGQLTVKVMTAQPAGEPCSTLGRNPHSAWNPQAPAGTVEVNPE